MPNLRPASRGVLPPVDFDEVLCLIQSARQRAFHAVNVELIDLYWQVGQTISRKIEAAEWGAGVVDQLAGFLARTQPGLKGFSRQNMFRMRQFYEAYRDQPIVSALLRQLPWTHNLIILSQSKYPDERTILDPPKISAALALAKPAPRSTNTLKKQNAQLHEAAGRFGEIREIDWISRVSASRRGERHRNAFGICRCDLRYRQTGLGQ